MKNVDFDGIPEVVHMVSRLVPQANETINKRELPSGVNYIEEAFEIEEPVEEEVTTKEEK